MEDGGSHNDAGDAARTPPPPPEPRAADASVQALDPSFADRSDEPLILQNEKWDIKTVSALGALRMLIGALQTLADAMGDVPPTPPVSRPTTPKNEDEDEHSPSRRRCSPPEANTMHIGSPEAHPREPITIQHGVNVEDPVMQRVAIARRFFSKVAPPFSVSDYLLRMHHWCPHSPGVYLTAAVYCHRLCVAEYMVPATNRTIHRLSLAAIRVAAKATEDNKWAQERIAKVGGVSRTQLMNLEVTLCFLMNFELGVDEEMLAQKMYWLQQAGRQVLGARRASADFRLKLPSRRRSSHLFAS